MQLGHYLRLDFRATKKRKGVKIVKLTNPNEDRVVITIKSATRDKVTGKFSYKTEKSIDVFEAKPEEVVALVAKGLESATGTKLPGATPATPAATPVKK